MLAATMLTTQTVNTTVPPTKTMNATPRTMMAMTMLPTTTMKTLVTTMIAMRLLTTMTMNTMAIR